MLSLELGHGRYTPYLQLSAWDSRRMGWDRKTGQLFLRLLTIFLRFNIFRFSHSRLPCCAQEDSAVEDH